MPAGPGDFPRARRLLVARAFKRVFAAPIRSSDSSFTVLRRGNGLPYARLGLAISKKNARLAVERNRIKRVVRESFRQHLDQLKGLDVVVINRRGTAGHSNKVLSESLRRHWKHRVKACDDCSSR